jgi:type I restriction enzyme M protein
LIFHLTRNIKWQEQEMPANNELEKRLWEAADQLRANSSLAVAEYSMPVLGLIFLKFADARFTTESEFLSGQFSARRGGPSKNDYQAKGVLYLPEAARYSYLNNFSRSPIQ